MKSWYKSHQVITLLLLHIVFILLFYIEVIRSRQDGDMTYLMRYLKGVYIFLVILTYTYEGHHPHMHLMLYLAKRFPVVYLKHIASDSLIMIHMVIIILLHLGLMFVVDWPLIYIQSLMMITIQYTMISCIIFQITDHLWMRIVFQFTFYILFIYANQIKLFKPYLWFEPFQMTWRGILYFLVLFLLLMCIRFIKYQVIRVNP